MRSKKFKVKPAQIIPVDASPILQDKPGKFKIHPQQYLETQQKPLRKRLSRLWLIPLSIIILVFILITSFLLHSLSRFETAAGTPWKMIWNNIRAGINHNVFAESNRFSFLILGLDEIRNQREGSLLTDTMMVVSVDSSGRVTLISIPRDLWIDSLKTKINALYYYGEASNKGSGTKLVETVVSDITGIPIQGSMIVGMDTVKDVVNSLGGITVDIPTSFTDTQFPREQVNIQTTKDPALLYETVTFTQGKQQLSGDQAMKYMRSRNSGNEQEGNDLARVRRQQQVVTAIISSLKELSNITNPELLGSLYQVWKQSVKTDISDEQWISLGWNIRKKPITLITTQIPVQDINQLGIIYHPPIDKYGFWVYEPVDPSWNSMRIWVQEQLGTM